MVRRAAFMGKVVLADRVLEESAVVVEGERIVGIFPSAGEQAREGAEVVDYSDYYIAPGLIDLHLHGAMGWDVMDGSVAGFREIAAYQARNGVTGFVATTLAAPLTQIRDAVTDVKAALAEPLPSEILGLYLEGPFLSFEKKGAQNPEFIRPLDPEALGVILKLCGGLKTIITIAPEIGDNLNFIPGLRDNGLIVSIGHSAAACELAMTSFERGITHATHLYNAMSGFLPREPGVIGAVLDSGGVTAEVIADGIHVHPAALRLALRQKGIDGICLITDSLNAAGLGEGEYRVGGLDVVVRNGQARLEESGALAGSILTLNQAVKNMINWTGASVPEAVRLASLNPARVLGLDSRVGSIEKGKLANLAVFDRDFNVVTTILRGRDSRDRLEFLLQGRPE
ncbi:MAG: N-acetylglucosamine-6-phosphate deacetylase [Candidatus Aminicenantales bacterium]